MNRGASAPRLAIVLSHPTQYYSPWFRWLAAHTSLTIRAFYLWDFGVTPTRDPRFRTTFQWDVDLLSGYESEFVPNVARKPGAESFWGFNNPQLPARLSAWQPDALLLFGYAWASHLRAVLWARRRRVPIVFRGDSHFLGRPRPGWRRALPLRLLYAQFTAFAYVGAANRAYFETLGVAREKLFFAPHAVDATRFNAADPAPRAGAAELRRHLGLTPETRVVLFAGKFIDWKQPRELLEAFLTAGVPNTALVFVGDGPEKAALEAIARTASARISLRPSFPHSLSPSPRVHLLPFANQSEMPARYALADIFALPSRGPHETWGLAVNEAMHMGVPCLVSDRVGCQQDLVTDGETGWVFRAGNPADLQTKLATALRADLAALRPHVAHRISGYTYAAAADGLLAALRSI